MKLLTIHEDSRGTVRETYRQSWFPDLPPIRQLVRSESKPNTLRGMHRHLRQFDIWHIVAGSALVRLFDHTRWCNEPYPFIANEFAELRVGHTIAIPPGISHGFYTEPGCILLYGLTEEYTGDDEYGWFPFDGLDPRYPGHKVAAEIGIGWWVNWPIAPGELLISDRDLTAPRLADFKG